MGKTGVMLEKDTNLRNSVGDPYRVKKEQKTI